MTVKAYKTHKIQPGDELYKILDTYFPKLEENSVVAITSKIISICQGDFIKDDGQVDKIKLIHQEADEYYMDENLMNHFGILITTIKNSMLIMNAGVDDSNGNGYIILWPKHIEQTTETVWKYLKKKHQLKNLGVVITDSCTMPLRWGVRGLGIAWCGFAATKSYIGEADIFGKKLHMTKKSVIDGLATAVTVVTGEGAEQTPLAVVTDIPFVEFQDRPPTREEKELLRISKEKDVYGKLLTSLQWEKGGSR